MSVENVIIETFEKSLGIGFSEMLTFFSVLGGLLFFAAGAREGSVGLLLFATLNLMVHIWLNTNYYIAVMVFIASIVIVVVTFIFYREKLYMG
ncbi:MAG: hypothetical protein QXR93_07555 [Archaeoglobaceae archaeon]